MEYWFYPAIPAAVLGLSGLISYLFKIRLKKKTKEENVAEEKKKYRSKAKRKFKQKKKSLKTIIKKKSNANKKNKVTFQNPVVKYFKQPKPSFNLSNDKTDGNVSAQKKIASVQPYNVNITTSNGNEEASDISDLSDFPNENEEPENLILIPLIMQLPRTEIQNFVDLVKNTSIEFIEKSNSLCCNSCPRCRYLPETHLKSEEIQSNVFFQNLKNVKKFMAALHSTLFLEDLANNVSVLTREELEVYQRVTPMRHIFDYWDTSAKVKMPHLMEFANENKEPENVILLIPLIVHLPRANIQNFVDALNEGKEDIGPMFKTPPKSEEVQSNMFLQNFTNAYRLVIRLDDLIENSYYFGMPFTKVTVLSREELEVYRQMTPMRKRNIFDYWDPSAEEFVPNSETINYSKQ